LAKTPASQEETQLRKRARRRLVGAVALVLMAIVVLPMVLDGEPRQRPESVNIQIPPIPAQAPAQGPAPAPLPTLSPPAAAPAPSASTTASTPPVSSAGTTPNTPPAPSAVPAAPEPPAAAAAPAPAPATPAPAAAAPKAVAAGPSESLVIQVGCFADAGKSRTLVNQIKASKIPAFSEPAGREHACTRVRAGPFSSQEAAQSGRERLVKLKLIPPSSEGKIVRRGD
jgi:DedD protein